MLDTLNLAIVDVETTGSSALYDRVIEIGVHRVERGRLADSYSTLVRPGRAIPATITRITGITDRHVADAPAFEDIARRLRQLLGACVFVAHNVRFDYGFLRNEFNRAGITYTAECLCSVRLSRLLYPRHRRHSLSALIERFEFPCANRHRALDDAGVIWSFFQHIQANVERQKIEAAVSQLLKTPTLPPRIDWQDIRALPQGPGVYVFYDETDMPLYIGKSVDVRDRVLSHFCADYRSGKEMHFCQHTSRIEAHPTQGELGALLLESRMIKSKSPLYNRLSRIARKLVVLRKGPAKKGYDTIRIEELNDIGGEDQEKILGLFRTRRQALEALSAVAKEHQLCPRLLGLECSGQGKSCIYRQMKLCLGACAGQEPAALFNARLALAFRQRRIQAWPYPGSVVIEEKSRGDGCGDLFIVDQWRLIKALRYDEAGMREWFSAQPGFDYDVYKILLRYLPAHAGSVRRLTAAEARQLCVDGMEVDQTLFADRLA